MSADDLLEDLALLGVEVVEVPVLSCSVARVDGEPVVLMRRDVEPERLDRLLRGVLSSVLDDLTAR